MVLSGGLSYDTVGRRACLTVMHGKSTAVLEMDYPIVDFLTLCETPYPNGELQHFTLVTGFDHLCQSVLAQWNYIIISINSVLFCFFLFFFFLPDFQEPYAVVVLLERDLVLIDLGQIG